MSSHSVLSFLLLGCAAAPCAAVIVPFGSGRNLEPPTGALANAGWQWQVEFTGFLGTAISPNWFITAQHVGGPIGGPVIHNGNTTFTDALVNIPGTDLRLWRITGSFDAWAPLWDPAVDGQEVGKRLFVVGRGTQRGEPVFAPINGNASSNNSSGQVGGSVHFGTVVPPGHELRGWKWGADDRAKSWGENVVTSVIDGGPSLGPLLYFTFDANGLLNEAALSTGDSGGGVFVRDSSGQYKLAGINFGVDGPFRDTPTSSPYFAALFDMGGFFEGNTPEYVPPRNFDQPAGAYVSRTGAHLGFIHGVIAGPPGFASIPEPSAAAGLLSIALLARRTRGRGRGA